MSWQTSAGKSRPVVDECSSPTVSCGSKAKNNKYIACGLLSGVITKTICAPFDRIRLLYQIQPMFAQVNIAKQEQPGGFKYRGVLRTAQKIIHEEGLTGLWRGNLMNTTRGGLCYATKFGINDGAKERLQSLTGVDNGVTLSLLAGASAGVLQKSISYPLDVMSVRMTLGVNTKVLSSNCTYHSIPDCFFKILRSEGIRGFFKGFLPTLCTGVPYVSLQMTFFDFYKRRFMDLFGFEKEKLNIKQVAFVSSIAGSAAGFSALSIVFPGDTVRKRMMNNAISNDYQLYRSSRHCVKTIFRCEGISAFYHGMFPSLLKSLPSGAVQFVTYEVLKHLLKQA
ncbi:Mitochondrial substrate carrier family protein A [Babesia sp. Xinjiang]|uniref:Mitochondrial substrate carrier family protein A n=1 Tax=Babesia sp. Xinjiang TaxID=462227 RepID=UPI000A243E21|nr:Mitochondrial substrate carrier family protein A [Babesia sp. Xinjiang]ORM41377.1 Mitochondrial substrate carrier family protein A [Babesia sp. Xinjiang]